MRAVDGIDLHLEIGEIAALLGPNGAGKTTTIDMILGLGQPDQGTVSVLGMSPAAAVSRGLVSAVLQTGGLLKDLTVRETVRLTASLYAEPRPVDEVLERAGISHLADRLVGKCSGGEQQRLRFALALLPDPALMALDEPTAGMDVEGRRDFWSAIRRDAERGRTVLFATHYLEEADAYADRIILLRQGRIVADGTAAEVRNLSSGRSVRASLADADEASLSRLPGVRSVEIRGDRVLIQTMDSDAVARYLLTATAARDVEIVAHNLEDAFLALTSDEAATGHGRPRGRRERGMNADSPLTVPRRRAAIAAAGRLQPHLPVHRGPPSPAQPADRGGDHRRPGRPVPAVQGEQAVRRAGRHRIHGRHDDDRRRRLRGDAGGDLGRRHGLRRTRPGLEPPASAHATATGCLHRHQDHRGDAAGADIGGGRLRHRCHQRRGDDAR